MGEVIMRNNIDFNLIYSYRVKDIIMFLLKISSTDLNEDMMSKFVNYDEEFFAQALDYTFKFFPVNFNKKRELAEKINNIMSFRKRELIKKFEDSIHNATYEQFLSGMSWVSKSGLTVDIELNAAFNNRELTDIEKKMISILNESIDKDIKSIALSEGFDSVDAWKENNARKYANMSERSINVFPQDPDQHKAR